MFIDVLDWSHHCQRCRNFSLLFVQCKVQGSAVLPQPPEKSDQVKALQNVFFNITDDVTVTAVLFALTTAPLHPEVEF